MKWLVALAALIIGVMVVYEMNFPSVTVRYRLRLEAQVDGVSKTGSGVVEVTYGKTFRMASHELAIDYRGEAVVLDLGSRGNVFALLTGGTDNRSSAEWIVLRAFDFPGGSLPRPVEEGLRQVDLLTGKRELPLTSLPLLVRFRDLNDPRTVEKVDPLEFEKSFGAGVKLDRASLEIVSAGIWPLNLLPLPFNLLGLSGTPITTGIEKKLVWLSPLKGGYLDGAFASSGPALSNILAGGNFKAGL